jgi:hypothetical protein
VLDGLWSRSRVGELEGVPIRLLALEDLLLHLALHSSYHHRFDRSRSRVWRTSTPSSSGIGRQPRRPLGE